MKRYHYIYAHYTKDTNECFYIGVGTWTNRTRYKRANSISARNKFHTRIVNKHGIKVEIIKDGYTDRNKAINDLHGYISKPHHEVYKRSSQPHPP